MRQRILAGNWKMHKRLGEAESFVEQLLLQDNLGNLEIFLAVPSTLLYPLSQILKSSCNKSIRITLGAQNIHDAESGAFTGEISAAMAADAGAKFVLLGHSERRTLFHEDDSWITKKLRSALNHGLKPLLCVGENEAQLLQGERELVIRRQLKVALEKISPEEVSSLVVAYEPVWAIGTGKNAAAAEAEEVHKLCRTILQQLFSEDIAEEIPILYGGSVKPDNAAEFGLQADIDGLLVGGASLQIGSFLEIATFL
jgi:triosephosphate isomerase